MSAHERAVEEARKAIDALFDKGCGPHYAEFGDAAVAAYLAALELEGWTTVPKKPTEEMSAAYGTPFDEDDAKLSAAIYRAMLGAAPSPHDKEGEQ